MFTHNNTPPNLPPTLNLNIFIKKQKNRYDNEVGVSKTIKNT